MEHEREVWVLAKGAGLLIGFDSTDAGLAEVVAAATDDRGTLQGEKAYGALQVGRGRRDKFIVVSPFAGQSVGAY